MLTSRLRLATRLNMLSKALNTAKTSKQAHVLDGKMGLLHHGLDVLLRPRMKCIDAIVIVHGTYVFNRQGASWWLCFCWADRGGSGYACSLRTTYEYIAGTRTCLQTAENFG